MVSQVLRRGSLSRWAVAIGAVVAMPACDAAGEEHDASLRSFEGDFEDEDEGEGGEGGGEEPTPSSIQHNKGGVEIGCPQCGSHWTIEDVEDDSPVVGIYLDEFVGDRILSLADEGTFYYRGWWGKFSGFHDHEEGGYVIHVERTTGYIGEGLAPKYGIRESGLMRTPLKDIFVELGLKYVNNKTEEFEDPPANFP